jgi:hypothetical protein
MTWVTAPIKVGISPKPHSDRLPDDQVDAEWRRAEDQPDYRQEVEPPAVFTRRRSQTNSENYLDKNKIVVEEKELILRISQRHKTQT